MVPTTGWNRRLGSAFGVPVHDIHRMIAAPARLVNPPGRRKSREFFFAMFFFLADPQTEHFQK